MIQAKNNRCIEKGLKGWQVVFCLFVCLFLFLKNLNLLSRMIVHIRGTTPTSCDSLFIGKLTGQTGAKILAGSTCDKIYECLISLFYVNRLDII